MSEEKKCIQCGTDLPEDAMFCPECGARQPMASQETSKPELPDEPAETMNRGIEAGKAAVAPSSEETVQPAADATASPEKPIESPSTTGSFDPFAATAPSKPVDPAQSFQYTMPAPPPEPVPPPYAQSSPSQQNYQQPAQPGPYAQQNWAQASQPQQAPPPSWQQASPPASAGVQQQAMGKGAKRKAAKTETVAPQSNDSATISRLPVATLVILGLTFVGLLVWFLMYNSAKLPPFDFSAATANGVVFAFLLMTILAIAGATLFRFNMRGSKLAVLGDILLVVVLLVMFYGISVSMFKETNLFYKLFISITGGGA